MIYSIPTEKINSDYSFKEDRRYNHTVRYLLPFDEEDGLRLFNQHCCFKYLLNGKYIAPVQQILEKGTQVLDSACGYGASWSMEMSKEYPNSQFFGVDISDGFPINKPNNVSFSIGDISKRIPFSNETFGYVYQRLVFAALSSEEWDRNLKELYRVLKPGGYVEFLEFNLDPFCAGPLLTKLMKKSHLLYDKKKLVFYITKELVDRLEKAGFVNCVTKIQEYPLNHGEHGELCWTAKRGALRGFGPFFVETFSDWETVEDYNKYIDDVGAEVKEYRSYFRFYTVYAQKP